MLTLTPRHQIIVGLALAALMAITRGHHFASLAHLPGASWAVFFLAGVYLCPNWVFPALLGEAAFLDYAAITWDGVSSFCVSPAYVFLLPAYGALWLAGHSFAKRYCFEWSTLVPLVLSVFIGALVCELFSSGGFYFLSGRFGEPTLVEFSARLLKYFPSYLQSLAFYLGIAIVVHAIFTLARGAISQREPTNG